MIRLLSTLKPSSDGSTAPFLRPFLPALPGAWKPSSACAAAAGLALPLALRATRGAQRRQGQIDRAGERQWGSLGHIRARGGAPRRPWGVVLARGTNTETSGFYVSPLSIL